jgi:hypothetical protein
MRFEFSKNLNRLLRNSLTVEMPDFPQQIAIRERVRMPASSHINRVFTMTGVGRACVPLPVR